MSNFKIRRPILANSGLVVPSGTSSSFNGSASFAGDVTISGTFTTSGSVANAASANTYTALKVGSTGISMGNLIYGTNTITAISTGAGSPVAATKTIANINQAQAVFVTCGSIAACMIFTGAAVTSNSVLTLNFYNSGSAATADCPITFSYLAVR